MQVRQFNKALFEVGDAVRSRHPEDRILGDVDKQQMITNDDGFSYQVIWVNDGFYSAWDFEPVNPRERKLYYAEYAKHGVKAKAIGGNKNTKAKAKPKPTINLKKIRDGNADKD